MSTCTPCPPVCRNPFDRVLISRAISVGTRIIWSLSPSFAEPGPLTFTIYYNQTGRADADGWVAIGPPVIDAYSTVDLARRDWGLTTITRYKVQLSVASGDYDSEPVLATGHLDKRDWLIVREAVRQRRLLYRRGEGVRGFLLKYRLTGEKCPDCADPQTGDPTDPACPSCYGTGRRCGYLYPASCTWLMFSPSARQVKLTPAGTDDEKSLSADMLVYDPVEPGDLWVDAATDERLVVEKIGNKAEVRGVPVAAQVSFSRINYSSPLYNIPIPQRLGEIV